MTISGIIAEFYILQNCKGFLKKKFQFNLQEERKNNYKEARGLISRGRCVCMTNKINQMTVLIKDRINVECVKARFFPCLFFFYNSKAAQADQI